MPGGKGQDRVGGGYRKETGSLGNKTSNCCSTKLNLIWRPVGYVAFFLFGTEQGWEIHYIWLLSPMVVLENR